MIDPSGAHSSPLSRLQQENAALRRELEQVRLRLQALEAEAPSTRQQKAAPAQATAREQLAVVQEELVVMNEELEVANEELRQQNEELEAAQYTLAMERQRYRELFDLAPDPYLVTDRRGIILEANRIAGQYLGAPAGELAGVPLIVYVASAEREAFRSRLEALPAQRAVQDWELSLRPPLTRPFSASVNVMPIVERDEVVGWRWLLRDITARKQMEEALRESEERFRILANDAPVLIWVNGPEGCDFVNRAYVEFLGVPLLAAVRGYDWAQFVHPDDREAYVGEYRACFSRRAPFAMQFRFRRHDGVYRWMQSMGVPRLTLAGELLGYTGSTVDISDIKEAEANLRRERALLSDVLNALPIGVWLADAAGTITHANPAGERIWAGTRYIGSAQLGGYNAWRADTGQRIEPQDWGIARAIAKGDASLEEEFDIECFDGTRKTILNSALPLRDESGQIVGAIAVNQDITARKQAEAALRESEARFRHFAEAVEDVFWITDTRAPRVLYVSPAYETIWGRSREALYQNPLAWLEAVHPDDRTRVEQAIGIVSEGRSDGEYRILRPDGSVRWVRDRGFPMTDQRGEAYAVAGIAEDVTERKRLEQAKSEFISIVSHELRTPLTSIKGALGLVRGGVTGELPPKARELCEIAYRNTERLTALVNDILAIHRLETDRLSFVLRPVAVSALLAEAVSTNQPFAKQLGVTLVLEATDAALQVQADPDRLDQVLTNLLSNAAKFSPRGETVAVRARRNDGWVRVEVADHGPGIPEGFRDRVFEKFAQANATDAKAKGGTGLGLSICKAIVERHGGRIGFDSEAGGGATFWFELPESED